ncbi:MAG: type II toxin-antitoxin system VapC family toxin [bacterium]|nr:type II toxin-antitoxin system VapC family toxin [bacterium]
MDASAVVAALIDTGRDGKWAESAVAGNVLAAPELVLVESTNILRRLERAEIVSRVEANGAQADLLGMEIELFPFAPFARRIWELRSNLTSYDAWYVALAEALDCPLLTLDRKLSRTPGLKCAFIVPAQPPSVGS